VQPQSNWYAACSTERRARQSHLAGPGTSRVPSKIKEEETQMSSDSQIGSPIIARPMDRTVAAPPSMEPIRAINPAVDIKKGRA